MIVSLLITDLWSREMVLDQRDHVQKNGLILKHNQQEERSNRTSSFFHGQWKSYTKDEPMKSAGWIPCLSFRWVPNVPWFHSSSAKASQKNKACTLERHQMATCLYCCLASTIQHLSKVKHLRKTGFL